MKKESNEKTLSTSEKAVYQNEKSEKIWWYPAILLLFAKDFQKCKKNQSFSRVVFLFFSV